MWAVIYPADARLSKQQRASREYDLLMTDIIGSSAIEQANQAACHMLGTDRRLRVINDVRATMHRAISEFFENGEVPALEPELWPKDMKVPTARTFRATATRRSFVQRKVFASADRNLLHGHSRAAAQDDLRFCRLRDFPDRR
jgi:hypothetical protein